ncbi:MAG TPA: class I SAM-dependent methyltransferase [Kiloniellales bacterium]|nr:class I SAM-dependent methyltransferase [Kiloniellales bacterium]
MTRTLSEERLNDFLGKMLNDVGAAMNASLLLLGDKLGLYKALAEGGSMTSADLAKETDTDERYLREWLAAQAASGYVTYDPANESFSMQPEQAAVLAEEDGPFFLAAVGDLVAATVRDEPHIGRAFRSGEGVGWDKRSECLFCGTARFFRTSYKHHLVQEWLPALTGVIEKLERGATVADIGCGHGVSTLLMARAFPKSRFFGFDYHQGVYRAGAQGSRRRRTFRTGYLRGADGQDSTVA